MQMNLDQFYLKKMIKQKGNHNLLKINQKIKYKKILIYNRNKKHFKMILNKI